MLPTIRDITIFTKVFYDKSDLKFVIKKINFDDNNELRNVKLWGVQTWYKYLYSKTPSLITYDSGQIKNDPNYNLPIIDKDSFQRSFLNLYDINNDHFLVNAPFSIFQTIENNQNERFDEADIRIQGTIVEKDHKIFNGQLFDLQNSYITITSPNEHYPEPGEFVIPITFYYSRIELDANTNILKK